MKNVLVTGVSGFIGKRLLDFLKLEEECNLILLTKKKIQGCLCVEHQNYQYTVDDFKKAGVERVDVVIHVGAFAPSKRGEMDDIPKTTSNILNTEHLIKELPNTPERVVFCSTKALYGEAYAENVNESCRACPETLYGISKLFCERMISSWGEQNGVKVAIARFGSIYGAGEDKKKDYLIPHLIKKAIKDEKITIFSDGSEKRAYLYVDDLCRYLCKLALHTEMTGILNLVSAHSVTVNDILNAIEEISGKQLDVEFRNQKPQWGEESYDTSLLDKVLGVEEISLKDGLTEVYKYWEENGEV